MSFREDTQRESLKEKRRKKEKGQKRGTGAGGGWLRSIFFPFSSSLAVVSGGRPGLPCCFCFVFIKKETRSCMGWPRYFEREAKLAGNVSFRELRG